MAKSKIETAFETIRDAFKNNANLAAAITADTGMWYLYESVHADFPTGTDEEAGVNYAHLPCVILRMSDVPLQWQFNVPVTIPLATRVDIRSGKEDQRQAVRLLTYVLQVIANQQDANWGLSSYGCEKTEARDGPRMTNLFWNEQGGGTVWRITFDLVVHLRINPTSDGLFES